MTTIRMVEEHLKCTYVTAGNVVEQFVEPLKLLREITGKQRNRLYVYEPYLALFNPAVAATSDDATTERAIETTGGAEQEG